MSFNEQLQHLIQELDARNMIPEHMDIAKVGKLHMVNFYNQVDSKMVASSVTTGMDQNLNIAALKALSEFMERSAFQEGFYNKNPFCQTERSDGFAAFPRLYPDHHDKARSNALNEAIERYVWATWWDNKNIAYEIESINSEDKNYWKDSIAVIEEINSLVGIKELKVIRPKFFGYDDRELLIVACETLDGGVITGGACGLKSNRDETILRAISELGRHALGVFKSQTENLKPNSFYEKRLSYFMKEEGFSLYRDRLNQNGAEIIQLPNLEIDNEIKHEFLDLFYVHRCLFENQPPFIGGDLERLCI